MSRQKKKAADSGLAHQLRFESMKFIICENGTTIMKVSVVGLWELFSAPSGFTCIRDSPFKELSSRSSGCLWWHGEYLPT